ncbi:MAG: hypothetical protein KC619_16995 [Myxococcales bacterium]|nr:hypothetical protein [Myxococcales bacterium]MCA9607307.1 hypothetical protein [Myxococcales bacterium]
MADSAAFEAAAAALEAGSPLTRLEARGTLRIALKRAGLTSAATREEVAVAVERLLPDELATRGVPDANRICRAIALALTKVAPAPDAPDDTSPAAVFRRLRGG